MIQTKRGSAEAAEELAEDFFISAIEFSALPNPHVVSRLQKRKRNSNNPQMKPSSIRITRMAAALAILLVLFFAAWKFTPIRQSIQGATSNQVPSPSKPETSSSQPDRNQRPARQRADTPPKEQVSYKTMRHSKIKMLKDGKVSDEAAEVLELTDSERALTEKVIEAHFKKLRDLMAPTVVTTENEKSTNFFIPALEDHGKAEIESFLNELSSTLQYERANKVLELLPMTKYFGAFGQFDTTMEVTSMDHLPINKRPSHDWIKSTSIDPETGKTMRRLSATTDIGFGFFPGIFEDSKE